MESTHFYMQGDLPWGETYKWKQPKGISMRTQKLTHWILEDVDVILNMQFSILFYWLISQGLSCIPQNLTDDNSTLVQVMAWCHRAGISNKRSHSISHDIHLFCPGCSGFCMVKVIWWSIDKNLMKTSLPFYHIPKKFISELCKLSTCYIILPIKTGFGS